jgi:hypothetical protein
MLTALFLLMAACDDGGKSDSADGGGTPTDDSATPSDDSATEKPDDTGVGCTELEWFQDIDGDGYGAGIATLSCESPGTGWVGSADDCNDSVAEVNPGATETCNAQDDDCDAAIDDKDDDVVATEWYPDGDGDGFGDTTGSVVVSCLTVSGSAPLDAEHGADCDDADATVYPGALELCDDVQQDCAIKGWKGDVGVATWYPADGGWEDWTDLLADGKYGAPAKIEFEEDGQLVICDGTWYASLNVKRMSAAYDVTVTGLHGAELTILSGGDEGRPIGVFQDTSTFLAEGLTLTEGNACDGAAVSTVLVSSCTAGGSGYSDTYDVSVTLKHVRIEDNVPTLAAGAVVYGCSGTIFAFENTTIANNSVMGVWTREQSISCTGDLKSDAGVWGNQNGGVFVWSPWDSTAYTIQSDGCDWEGSGGTYTPYYDVGIQNMDGDYVTFEYGDDETFLCSVPEAACAK